MVVAVGAWSVATLALTFACNSSERDFGNVGAAGEGGGDVGSSGGSATAGKGGGTSGSGVNTSGDAGAGGGDDQSCTPGEKQSCYESADGVSYGGMPPAGQTTCRTGERQCNPDTSVWDPCVGAVSPLEADTCEPGNDANCNGMPNEGCKCTNGETRECGTDAGNCVKGQQTCAGQMWGECVGEVKPAATDSCDEGDDANCNDMPNDGCVCINGKTKDCGTDVGPCEFGTLTCANGAWPDESECVGGVKPAAKDTCEPGNDADCSGTANVGCGCTGTDSKPCGSDVGACKLGTQSCVSGMLSMCTGGVNPSTKDTCTARLPANDTNCNGDYGDGCECVASDGPNPAGCGDTGCGQQLCDGATGKYKACSNANSNNRCNPNDLTQRQVCGGNGVFVASACPNPATQQCSGSGVCKLKDGEVCTVAGDCATGVCNQFYTDADGDTYRANNTVTNLCGTVKTGYVLKSAANASADCTNGDGNEFVHPGAEEVCDGFDNDCDTKTDRDDLASLLLGGGSESQIFTSGSTPKIAWGGTRYGVAYTSSGTKFGVVDQANTTKTVGKVVGNNSGGGIGLAWNGTAFGIFTSEGDVALNFFKATNAANPSVSAGSPASFGTAGQYGNMDAISAAPMGTTGWLLGATSEYYSYQSYAYVISAAKNGVDTKALLADQKEVRVAVSGSTYGVIYRQYVDSMFQLYFTPRDAEGVGTKTFGDNTAPYTPVSLGNYASQGAIAPRPGDGTGFAVAWILDNGSTKSLYYKEIGLDGAGICGSISKTVSEMSWPESMVPTKRGFLIALRNSTGIELHEVLNGCKFAPNPYLAVDTAPATNPQLAAGTNGYMLTWENSGTIYTKALGPDICN
jgi:hypothetical protein